MIKIDRQRLSVNEAARMIIDEGLAQSLHHWEHDTDAGQQLAGTATPTELGKIDQTISNYSKRIRKLIRIGQLYEKLETREEIE